MAKFSFIQNIFIPNLGIMYLSSYLKMREHRCNVLIGSTRHILRELEKFSPDVIAFSCMSGEMNWLYETAHVIKRDYSDKVLTLVGGTLATFTPEIIKNPDIDIICRGEGELAIAELAEKLDNGKDINSIKNIWIKENGGIIKNSLRPLVQNLNELPFPDRDIYKKYPFVMQDPNFLVLTTRGCPFSCSYCVHEPLRELYSIENNQYIRRRTVENVILEILEAKQKYSLEKIWIIDDTFFLDSNWTENFLARYKSEIAVPFICSVRIDFIDKKKVKLLKECNYCHSVCFGIETENESYRKNILNRNMANNQIIKNSILFKRNGIKISTTNMMGLPGESLQNAMSTINLNKKVSPYSTVCTIYQPHPGTELYDYAIENLFFKNTDIKNLPAFTHGKSLLKQKDIKNIINLHKFFYVLVYMPYLFSIVKILIKLPYNIIYFLCYTLGYIIFFMKRLYKINLYRILKEIIIALRYYIVKC